MDVFTYRTANTNENITSLYMHIWSPYLQKFLYRNDILKTYNVGILEEFYVPDITEGSNPYVFKNKAYRDGLFRKIEIQNPDLTLVDSFMNVAINYDMNETRNLPFFHQAEAYRVGSMYYGAASWFDAFHILEHEYTDRLQTYPSTHKALDLIDLDENIVTEGHVAYVMENDIIPTDIVKVIDDAYVSIAFNSLMVDSPAVTAYLADYPLLSIIKDYLNDTLVLSDELLTTLNNYYYDIEFKDYIFMPIIIFIIKKLIANAL